MPGRRAAGAEPVSRDAVPPWRAGIEPGRHLDRERLRGPVVEVARALLGMRLASTVDGARAVGVIVEVEAYGGSDDPASHAAVRAGRTPRNRSMFEDGGVAYVYRSYGVHWCLNVVTGEAGAPQAVLVRGLDPLEGMADMDRRRHGRRPLAAGPGRLCQALGVDGRLDGHDLQRPPLRLLPGWELDSRSVLRSRRIGVRRGAERLARFYVRGFAGPRASGGALT